MTTLSPTNLSQPPSPNLLQKSWAMNKLMTIMIVVTAIISIFAALGMFADSRTILGQPVWAKSTKFALSMAIYGATLLWMFSYIKPRPKWVDRVLNITGYVLLLEIVLLVTQAVRGQRMHYNRSTPFDSFLYTMMATSIYLLFAVTLFAAVKLMRAKLVGRSFAWSLRLGLLVTVLAGYGVANLMVTPTPMQMEGMMAGEAGAADIIGAHTVGAEDGGAGLPLLGWSTTHGDLRPAHFFGLHALQIIPLIGLFISRRKEEWLTEGHKISLVAIVALAYTGFIGLTTWQALRAEPLIYPSATTMMAFATLIGVNVLLGFITLGHSYTRS